MSRVSAGANPAVWTLWYTVGGDRVAYRDGSTLTWIYGGQVGSTTLTRTETGANKRQRYTPWGELRTNANLTTDRHYTGQIADLETGLAFYNARYYDPTVGQFTAADTIIANPSDGQNFNRYSYVLNNPVNYNDPTGNWCVGGFFGTSCDEEPTIVETVETEEEIPEPVIDDCRKNLAISFLCGAASETVGGVNGILIAGANPIDTAKGTYAMSRSCGAATPAGVCLGRRIVEGTAQDVWNDGKENGVASASGKSAATLLDIIFGRRGTGSLDNIVRTTPSVNDVVRRVCSFSADTEVLMADGTKESISEIVVGDWVLAEDPETGERGARAVTSLWVHQDTLVDLEIDGVDVTTTEDHPFWNATDTEWQRAVGVLSCFGPT